MLGVLMPGFRPVNPHLPCKCLPVKGLTGSLAFYFVLYHSKYFYHLDRFPADNQSIIFENKFENSPDEVPETPFFSRVSDTLGGSNPVASILGRGAGSL